MALLPEWAWGGMPQTDLRNCVQPSGVESDLFAFHGLLCNSKFPPKMHQHIIEALLQGWNAGGRAHYFPFHPDRERQLWQIQMMLRGTADIHHAGVSLLIDRCRFQTIELGHWRHVRSEDRGRPIWPNRIESVIRVLYVDLHPVLFNSWRKEPAVSNTKSAPRVIWTETKKDGTKVPHQVSPVETPICHEKTPAVIPDRTDGARGCGGCGSVWTPPNPKQPAPPPSGFSWSRPK